MIKFGVKKENEERQERVDEVKQEKGKAKVRKMRKSKEGIKFVWGGGRSKDSSKKGGFERFSVLIRSPRRESSIRATTITIV